MTNIERLRQYLSKVSFSSASDSYSAFECLSKIEQETEKLIENIEIASEEWARYVEVDSAPITLPRYISNAIAKSKEQP